MSARGVQRIIDRLMSDERYRRSFGTDFEDCVAGYDLTADEKKMLAAVNTAGNDLAAQLDNLVPDVVGQWGDHGWEK
jgi:hypothetical protein